MTENQCIAEWQIQPIDTLPSKKIKWVFFFLFFFSESIRVDLQVSSSNTVEYNCTVRAGEVK